MNMYNNMQVIIIDGKRIIPILSFIDKLSMSVKIRYLDINFSEIEIYVYRETKGGRKALAKPCAACTKALRDLGIKKVCYTTNDGYCEERYEN